MTVYARAHAVASTMVGTTIMWPLSEPAVIFGAKAILKVLGY